MSTPFGAPYPSTVKYRGTPGARFMVTDGVTGFTSFVLDANGRADVSFRAFSHLSVPRLFYAGWFALFAFATVLLIPWRRVASALREQAGFALSATAILAVEYAAAFPGFFAHDLLLQAVNIDGFTAWYSALFFVYNYLFVFAGFDWLQAPPVLLTLGVTLLINQFWRPDLAGKVFLLAMLVVNPFLFAATFAGQRYFVAALLALLGLTLLFAARRAGPGETPRLAVWSLIVLVMAGLMRAEYWLFWVIALVFWASVLLRGAPQRRTKVTAAVVFSGLTYIVVNLGLPWLHGEATRINGAKYQMTLLTDLAVPYACAGDARIAAIYERFGPVEDVCAKGGEIFYWTYVSDDYTDKSIKAAQELRGLLVEAVLANPMPEVTRAFVRLGETVRQDVWQVFNRFDGEGAYPPGSHQAMADSWGLVYGLPVMRPVHDAMVVVIKEVANPRYWLLAALAAMVVLAVPRCLMRRLWLTGAVGLAVVAIAMVSIVFSPVANWGYIVMVPLWGTFLVPFALMEAKGPTGAQ